MSRDPEKFDSDRLLNQGLRRLPVPATSSDFNARVHAALRRPIPWWQSLWRSIRPVLTATACSLVVTLVLLQGFANPALTSKRSLPSGINQVATAQSRARMNVLDRGIDGMDLSGASWHVFTILWWSFATQVSPDTESAPQAAPPDHRSQKNTLPAIRG